MSNHHDAPLNFVWAVDPYESELRPDARVVEQLKALAGNSLKGASPVFVCGTEVVHSEKQQKQVEEYFNSIVGDEINKPQILYTESTLKKDWISSLISFAAQKKAEMLVLTSHGRAGLSRIILGSFAEALLAKSPLPVLFLRKSLLKDEDLGKGVFATDFSESSERAFEIFVSLFGNRLEEITLFHSVSFPEGSLGVAGAAGVPVVYPDSYIKDQAVWAKEKSKAWMEKAKNQGVSCRLQLVIDEKVVMNPTAAIEKFMEANRVGFLGMASHSSSMSKFLLGSVAQNLIAMRKFSIWVCGPSSFKKP